MKRLKKAVAAIVAATLLMALCGCNAQVAIVEVEEDGSGTITAFVGATKAAMKDFATYSGENLTRADLEGLAQFQRGGVTYYGRWLEGAFTDPQNLVMEFEDSSLGPDGGWPFDEYETLDFGDICMEKLNDGNLLLMVTISGGDKLDLRDMNPALMELMEKHKDSSLQMLTFHFPGTVQQIGGCFNGIEVNGNEVTLDYIKMAGNSCQTYNFKITIPVIGELPIMAGPIFDDVPVDAWYADAVVFMNENRLVSGYGGGKFGPGDSITIAQFAQILAKAQGLETGPGETGWWAEKALVACLDKGWLTNRGAVEAENYSTTIRRQEAIAAMQRASQRPALEGNHYTLTDIPDYENICEKYREDAIAAYNSGITSGTDSKGTMLPLNTLTRAEVCQLFYNLKWGAKEVGASMNISKTELALKVGERAALTLSLTDAVTDSMVVWASSAPRVATVSRGVVTAVGEGVATIMASVGEETVSCTVIVSG